MLITKEIAAKEARVKFGEVMDRARYGRTSYLVKKGTKPMAVILGIEEYDDLLDLMDTMAEQMNPKFQAQLAKSMKAYRRGEFGAMDDVRKILRREKDAKI